MKNLILFITTILVSLNSFSQNQPPVSINDTLVIIHFPDTVTIIEVNVLQNDYDPEGDPIEIFEISSLYDKSSFTSNTIIDTITGFFYNNYSVQYRVREVADTASVSDWASLYLDIRMDINAPIALNDTIHNVFPGYDYYLNLIENDISPTGDTLMIYGSVFPKINDSVVQINISITDYDYLYSVPQIVTGDYLLIDTILGYGTFDMASIVVFLDTLKYYDTLNINNANALFNCWGNHLWDHPGGPRGGRYYIPKESMISALFSNSIWIGGLDNNDSIHLAAERYRQMGEDYFYGPVSNVYDLDYDKRWFRVWKLTRDEVNYHNANWWTTGYVPIQDIASWPGNGKVENGESAILAPFFDKNQNGIYEPLEGDCPRIKGDQALFFIFNDMRNEHTESDGRKLGIEIHGMAYAFDKPEDSVLWNTTFVHYDIINLSDTTYHDTYLGVWTDIDLGNAWDDFVGCDVKNGFYYGYNGDEDDETSNGPDGTGELQLGYEEHPPAIGVTILGGPYMESDEIDNPKYDGNGLQICDYSINGLNFGDTIIDNERFGMTGFLFHNNSGGLQGDPSFSSNYYKYLTSRWQDGSHLMYGGMGHVSSGAVGPECRFMFPGDSDTCNWGTDGIPPNGGYNQNGYYWTEITNGDYPSDRRGLGISGPFTFEAGETQSVDFAFVFARDYDGTAWSSVELLRDRVAYLKNLFEENEELFSSIKTNDKSNELVQIYPNPAKEKVTFLFSESNKLISRKEMIICNLQGIIVKKVIINNLIQSVEVDISTLSPGMFLFYIQNENGVFSSGKLIKK
jgi:hypothetical protein